MLETKKSGFFPVNSLEGKANYKRFFRIESDGSVIERVFLDVPDISHREFLICLHYLKHLTKVFLSEPLGINILGRDMPWDFKLELSTGNTFNLEITSIADCVHHFEINKREERLRKWSFKETIPLRELIKLNRMFPDQRIAELVKMYEFNNVSENDFVQNPLNDTQPRIVISSLPESVESLAELIRSVITKKINKKHPEKEKTVLLIDNRTSAFDELDYQNALESLQSFLDLVVFPEVWFYTGYYSDNDGNNAEFSFSPLKITDDQNKILRKLAQERKVDRSGRIVL